LLVQYNFIAPAIFRANCRRVSHKSLWNVTRDFLKKARQDFLGEAVFFGVIVIAACQAFISNAHAPMEFVRAISNY